VRRWASSPRTPAALDRRATLHRPRLLELAKNSSSPSWQRSAEAPSVRFF
jgi:hypothetical protein